MEEKEKEEKEEKDEEQREALLNRPSRPLAICKTKFVSKKLQVNQYISNFCHLNSSLYIRPNLLTGKSLTFLGTDRRTDGQTDRRTDGQTDRRTDRHDVTLEATPSKYFDGGLTKN